VFRDKGVNLFGREAAPSRYVDVFDASGSGHSSASQRRETPSLFATCDTV
jgi:hypothetical protein